MNTKLSTDKSVRQIEIFKVSGNITSPYLDDVSVEEPLEIRVLYRNGETEIHKNISVTMRTPGNDAELAAGFLFTEGIISSQDQVKNIENRLSNCATSSQNLITVELEDHFTPNLMNAERNFYTTSSCGVCGKGSIEAIRTVSVFEQIKKEFTKIEHLMKG